MSCIGLNRIMIALRSGCLAVVLLLFVPLVKSQQPADSAPSAKDTVKVEFSINHTNSAVLPASAFHPGETVKVRFSIHDKVSGAPLDGLHPAAWLDLHGEKETSASVPCKERVRKLLNTNFLSPPEIDLNGYYVIVMNNDATVSVVDPQFSSGASRVVATIPLASPAVDWQLSDDQKLLFVGMPLSGKVAVIDTASWRVIRNLDVGQGIGRVLIEPDRRRLWVTFGRGPNSGVAVVDAANLQVADRIQAGAGSNDITFSSDGQLAFLTNSSAGTVSVIDTKTGNKIHEIRSGHQPGAIAFSAKSGFSYVTDAEDGTVTVIDGTHGIIVTTIHAEPGLGAIRFARDGRFGIVLNPAKKQIHVLDSSSNRIVQTGDAEGQPDQVVFSGTLAHVRQRGSESVLMVPLDSIGVENKPLPEAAFPAGQHPLGPASLPTPADSIVQAPAENAVLVANPSDRSVYFYEEGMAAPLGYFSNGFREPRAVLVLDRSLKGDAKGVYETTTYLKRPGLYTMALLLDSPPAVQCWDVVVETDPNRRQQVPVHLEVQGLLDGEAVQAQVPITLHFRIWDSDAKAAKPGVTDVKVLLFRAPGAWHEYSQAKALDEGVYEAAFPSLEPGTYYLNVVSPSLGLSLNGAPIIFRAVAK